MIYDKYLNVWITKLKDRTDGTMYYDSNFSIPVEDLESGQHYNRQGDKLEWDESLRVWITKLRKGLTGDIYYDQYCNKLAYNS